MEILKAAFLGIVQGATEFLPVSSSGHLVLGSKLLNFQEQGVVFDVFVHLGTLLSVILVFRKDLRKMIVAPFLMVQGNKDPEVIDHFHLGFYVTLATIPIVIIGLLINGYIDQIFKSELIVYCMLIVTGVLMMTTFRIKERGKKVNWWRALVIGLAQSIAILPGLSRSGSTIFAGMALGINRDTAAKFAFLMSIPEILGAVVLKFGELVQTSSSTSGLIIVAVGTVTAAVSGYFSIVLLLDLIKRNRLRMFGYYCFGVALLGFGFYFL